MEELIVLEPAVDLEHGEGVAAPRTRGRHDGLAIAGGRLRVRAPVVETEDLEVRIGRKEEEIPPERGLRSLAQGLALIQAVDDDRVVAHRGAVPAGRRGGLFVE